MHVIKMNDDKSLMTTVQATIYGSRIHLGKGRSVDEFYEITDAEYEYILAQEEETLI